MLSEGWKKPYLIKINPFSANAPETCIIIIMIIFFSCKAAYRRLRSQIMIYRSPYKFWTQGSSKIAQTSLKTFKMYSWASLFQLKHHYSLRCWNHLALWMHSFVLKIPFYHAPGKTEVESKIINALKWFVCLSGNPPTVFPECRSLNPNASLKDKGTSKIAKDTV